MEKRIREYEKFIAEATAAKLNESRRDELANLHQETLNNFQWERLCHLLVTLFLVALTLGFIGLTIWLTERYGLSLTMLPLYLLLIISGILSGFYLKHYYFLENHIQSLYQYTRILRNKVK